MKTRENAITMKLDERRQMFITLRHLYARLDETIEAIYQPARYTMLEYEELARTYSVMQLKADRLEERIRTHYPSPDLEACLKWLKSDLGIMELDEAERPPILHCWFETLMEEPNNPGFIPLG